jgi:hypothetical protein
MTGRTFWSIAAMVNVGSSAATSDIRGAAVRVGSELTSASGTWISFDFGIVPRPPGGAEKERRVSCLC